MSFKVGDPVWIQCSRPEIGLQGERPGVVVADVGAFFHPKIGLAHWYGVEIFGRTCPVTSDVIPVGAWSTPAAYLRPRRDPPKQDWVNLCQLDALPALKDRGVPA